MDNRIGGIQTRVISIAKGLQREGIRLITVCPLMEGEFASKLQEIGCEVVQINLPRPRMLNTYRGWIEMLRWAALLPGTVRRLVRMIEDRKVDLVHANGLLCLQAAFAARISGRPLVWQMVGDHYPRGLVRLCMPLVRRLSTEVLFVAETMKGYYLGSGGKETRFPVIYEPVNSTVFHSDDSMRKFARDILGLRDEDFVVGCVGNVNPKKGYEYFIDAADEIARSISSTRFLIVGSILSTQRKYYVSLVNKVRRLGLEQRIVFLGPRNNVHEILPAFDVFLMTSISEGTPIAILEAMAAGLPVVAARVGAVAEQVRDGVEGFLVPPKNPSAAAARVIELWRDEHRRRAFGENGRKRVEQVFSVETCVRRYASLYSDVLQSYQSHPGRR